MFKLIKSDKFDSLAEKLLYYSYFVYQFMFLLHVSALAHNVDIYDKLTSIVIILSFGIILLIDLYYLLRGNYTLNEIVVYGIVGTLLLISLLNYSDVMVSVNLFAIMAFKNVNAKKGLKIYFIATIIGMICVMLLGIITPYTGNVIQTRYGISRIRYGLGFFYTSFALHYLFSLVLVFLIICKNVKFYHYVLIAVVNCILFFLTDTKAPFFYIWLILLVYLILTKVKSNFLINLYGVLTILSYPILSIFSIVTSYCYNEQNRFFVLLNKVLTGRLYLTHNALEKCKFTLFGQTVGIWGEGFYIDSSIINMLVLNGLIILIVSVVFMTIFSYFSAKNKSIPLMIALSFFALRSAFDWGFMAFQMTPVVILFYNTYIEFKKNNKVIINISKYNSRKI